MISFNLFEWLREGGSGELWFAPNHTVEEAELGVKCLGTNINFFQSCCSGSLRENSYVYISQCQTSAFSYLLIFIYLCKQRWRPRSHLMCSLGEHCSDERLLIRVSLMRCQAWRLHEETEKHKAGVLTTHTASGERSLAATQWSGPDVDLVSTVHSQQ